MIYVFDIDGTICQNTNGKYEEAKPFLDRIQYINKLYEENNRIIFFTARGMHRFVGDADKAHKQFYEFTYSQLESWGVKFHQLILGKPEGDIYIDDKGEKDVNFFRASVCS